MPLQEWREIPAGRATLGGRSGPLSDRADRELFHGLRTAADAVLVGAGTVRTERYGPIVKNDELRARTFSRAAAVDSNAVPKAIAPGAAGTGDRERENRHTLSPVDAHD